ncbi:2-amino-4-hydroxy-6-hydroxymethyldihydropteridine diphosphokinase [Rhodovulum sp. DZ06]|uniref:2-amino-4-hydroxy-6- hydroxymethyldihydropteridine diphosphokinase n=1 Tax=Rhodovulum sp. DZ06 TaxID=3425126 RepID=UPI003D34B68E
MTLHRAAIGIGGNIGERQAALAGALAGLEGAEGLRLLAASSAWETPPWGDTDQAPFLNACALVETTLAPRALLETLLGIEAALGRARDKARRWGPRLIDLDLLWHGAGAVNEPGLELPHPRMLDRAFVLVPLAEIAPGLEIGGRSIADWAEAADRDGMTCLGPAPVPAALG